MRLSRISRDLVRSEFPVEEAGRAYRPGSKNQQGFSIFAIRTSADARGFDMADSSKGNRAPRLTARELSCSICGRAFVFRGCEQEMFAQRGWDEPKRCPACRRAKRERKEKETRRESRKRQRERATEKELFEARLKDWKVVAKNDIHPENDHVLYIIGNGFDLMHGVRSSYRAFRDSLGKQNPLRFALENFLTAEDIWSDFEDALAHFDMSAMGSGFLVGDWLDMFDAYGEDAGASPFFLAAEAAANPILTVANELPRRFRMWVETLSIGTADRPLRDMFRNGKVLCFNYTEFVETLYGVSEDNVCYIHGCRRKKNYHPKETLILGHMPGASDDAYDFDDDSAVGTNDLYKLLMIEAAQEQVFRLAAESDEALTKNCGDIIAAHGAFFASLSKIENIIVIGHSLAPVDWGYFSEVASGLSDIKNTHWYFGCHGLRDLDNLTQLLAKLGIEQSAVSIFRTDNIAVAPLKDGKAPAPDANCPVKKARCASHDGRWTVYTADRSLLIVNQERHETDCEIMFSSCVGDAFFVPSGEYLFAVIRGVDPGIFLFSITDDHWRFVNELESIRNQSLINPRLHHVFLTGREITFVYNNRVRKYSLSDGTLVSNRALHHAGNFSYDGDDVSHLFLKVRQSV